MLDQEISCGFDYIITPDLQQSVSEMLNCGYSFIVTPIVHPRFRRQHCGNISVIGGFTRSDMVLAPTDWASRIVGKLSPYLDVDSPCPVVRQRHEDCMIEELYYCRGLGLAAILLSLHSEYNGNLARLIQTYHETSHHPTLIWVQVQMLCSRTLKQCIKEGNDTEEAWNEPWHWWSNFHERVNWDKRVGVVLVIPADLPPKEIMKRWCGEPIKAIFLPSSLFYENKKGFPVLSKAHQELVIGMMELEAQVVVTGAMRHNSEFYRQYIARIWNRRPDPNVNPMFSYARGWEDYLQTPLQPLADNLDTQTYNVFEKDPVKYNQYQKAIAQALIHWKEKRASEKTAQSNETGDATVGNVTKNVSLDDTSKNDTVYELAKNLTAEETSTFEDITQNITAGNRIQKSEQAEQEVNKDEDTKNIESDTVTVMVLGAGRGPLLRATFNAADITDTNVKVIAVEKNPCAVVVLSALVREVLKDRDVIVVPGDMRQLNLSPKADIIVSELLGSWGDNELSPECLDGAAGLLKPDGISIPCQYSSYVAPVSTARLWAAAKGASLNTCNQANKNLETLWVVYMQNKHDIAEPQSIFTFNHPSEPIKDYEGQEMTDYRGLPLTDNRRSVTVSWLVQQENVMHGFGGYFDCKLFGEEMISIVPSTHSPGMISWFPVFIPIRTPIRVRKGDVIKATFWRRVDSRRVWYEWLVEVGDTITPLHNVNGRSSEMLL